LSGDAFRVGAALFGDRMTISGTVNKTGILLICVVATAAWSWNLTLATFQSLSRTLVTSVTAMPQRVQSPASNSRAMHC
jgi:uncharacterized YccA/Bax inhibitor family protein